VRNWLSGSLVFVMLYCCEVHVVVLVDLWDGKCSGREFVSEETLFQVKNHGH